uniref:Uncharacterized protein n=1 Tax=Cacopsylla melanoneura TaxID=428564 RepID=A0A8D8Z4R6_9HEMI
MSNLLLQSQEPRGFFRMNLYSREKLPAEDFDLGRYLYLESNENEEKSSAVNCPIRWQDRRQPRTKRGNILFSGFLQLSSFLLPNYREPIIMIESLFRTNILDAEIFLKVVEIILTRDFLPTDLT